MPTTVEARWVDDVEDGVLAEGGLLGHAVLDGRRLVLDYPGGRVWLARSWRPARTRDGLERALLLERAAHGDAPERALERARLRMGQERYDDALDELRIAEAGGGPRAAEARVWHARILRYRDRFTEADAVIAPLSGAELARADALIEAVRAALLLGERARARQWSGQAPSGEAGAVARAEVDLATGDVSGARDAIADLSDGGSDATAHALLAARVAIADHDPDGAEAILRAAALADPLDGTLLWAYARRVSPGRRDTLAADLDHVRAATHPSQRPWDAVAAAARRAGRSDDARSAWATGTASACRPQRGPARDNCYAWFDALAGIDLSGAVRRAERAVRRAAPASADLLDTLATAHAALAETTTEDGRSGEAARHAEAAHRAACRAAARAPGQPYFAYQLDQHALPGHTCVEALREPPK